jgi:hypothetical protein
MFSPKEYDMTSMCSIALLHCVCETLCYRTSVDLLSLLMPRQQKSIQLYILLFKTTV